MYVSEATVVSLEPNTIADIFANIVTVAELCGIPETGKSVVKDLQSRLDNIKAQIREYRANPKSEIRNPKSVMMLEWLEPPFAPGHWVPEQVEIAGGLPLLGAAGEKSLTTTYAAIYESQPEILVLIPCGYYIADIVRQIPQTVFPANWRELPAVVNNNVWAVDASAYFSRPAPRVVDGAEILAKIFHPEIFGAPHENEAIRVQLNFAGSD